MKPTLRLILGLSTGWWLIAKQKLSERQRRWDSVADCVPEPQRRWANIRPALGPNLDHAVE